MVWIEVARVEVAVVSDPANLFERSAEYMIITASSVHSEENLGFYFLLL